ncbi:MAG TPA: NAD-dependent epimerase/dehydratase family protein [Candidatus Limnocylindrales bacterium]|nr:NAD-dependent epimerase/dehydratase family protein [Candidatus Limnocylindrales bacterium]
MRPATIVVTGGAGFVGSALALDRKQSDPAARVIAFDNLRRKGSELNLPRLEAAGVEFVRGDVRSTDDIAALPACDLLIECAAEPSVLASYGPDLRYVLDTNLVGTLNLLEYCREHGSKMLFLSTSRVYPVATLSGLRLVETATRFELDGEQTIAGASARGISEEFPLGGVRSIYGATKLASEMFIEEYAAAHGLDAIVDRCGVLSGPWQMGKIDQGVVVLWVARHVYGGRLDYIGYGGTGKQVRDVLHIDDLCDLVEIQLARFESLRGGVFAVGGGRSCSTSLVELTDLCRRITGRTIEIGSTAENRPADVPVYITDNSRIRSATGWTPARSMEQIVTDVHDWILSAKDELAPVLGG